jgi:hypothetical protein
MFAGDVAVMMENGGNIENYEIERGDTGWRETNLCTKIMYISMYF